MLTLARLRSPLSAALAAALLIVLFSCFLLPYGSLVCGGIAVLEGPLAGATLWYGSETDLVVTIRRDGATFVGPNAVAAGCLQTALSASLARGAGRALVLRPDRRSPFFAIRGVFKAAQDLGIRSIILPSGIHSVLDLGSTHYPAGFFSTNNAGHKARLTPIPSVSSEAIVATE